MTAPIPRSLDELLEERADLIRMAEAAEKEGRELTGKLYRHTARVVDMAIAERTAQ